MYRPNPALDLDIPFAYGNGWYPSGSPLDKLLGTSFQVRNSYLLNVDFLFSNIQEKYVKIK